MDPGTNPPDGPPVDPYVHAVESAAAAVTAKIDAHGTRFDTLTERNFPKAANPDQILKSLAAAIDGGHQALIDRFLGITPSPETRQQPPTFTKSGPSSTQLGQLVTAANNGLPPSSRLTVPAGDAMAARVALHTQISALSATEKAIVADTMVDNAFAQTSKKGSKLVNQLRVMLQLTGLQHIADQANANIVAAGLEQPGRWAALASEVGGETRPSSVFEQLITGGPKGIAYSVASPDRTHVSDFDGIRLREGGGFELLDSKGDYRPYVPGPGEERLRNEAYRQILAADGRPIVWVSQFGGAQLAGLQAIIKYAIAIGAGISPFTVTHETDRRPPPPRGDASQSLPQNGPTPPGDATPDIVTPPTTSDTAAPGSLDSNDSSHFRESTDPSTTDPSTTDPSTTDPSTTPAATPAPSGHSVSPISSTLVMNIPGTAFHGDAAGRTNTLAVTDAVAETMSETLRDSTRGRIEDAAGFQEIVVVDGNVFDATTINDNDVRITLDVGTTPTTQQGDRPLILIERTSVDPEGSTQTPSFTITISETALAEHVGQALADAFAQVSALTDGHSTRESVLSRDVDVKGPLFANDFSVTDLGTVGAIRYLQHSIDATHGKHRLQAMHMRHLVNVLSDAGMMLTPGEINALMRPTHPGNPTLPALNRLVALPKDIHHVVIAANIDPNAQAITTGMPSKAVYLARGMLQHGVAGLASGITVALAGLASGNVGLAVVRGASIFVGRLAGGIAQARGEFLQAQNKAWGETHNTANSIVRGGPTELITRAFLDQELLQLAAESGQPGVEERSAVPERPRPDTPRVPSLWTTAGRYGSAGLTSELVNVASFSAARMADAAVEQVMAQALTGTPGALIGAVSTIAGEHFLLNATEKQGGGRRAADNAVERDVAAAIRDVIEAAKATHTAALEVRARQIDDLEQRAESGETITADHVAELGRVPSFDETVAAVTTGIQQAMAVGPEVEAELVELVQSAEDAQTRLRTVMKTPTQERLALHAKLVELGMEMPDTVYTPDAGISQADAQLQAQAARAWVHRWLGLQTPDLADRLAKMSLRPTAVASLGAYELKNLLAGGVSSAATMTTFGVITGMDPAAVTVDALLSAAATTLVGGTMEHAVQTAAENRAQLANPQSVHQSPHKVAQFRHGIDITASIIERAESQQQARVDELLGVDERPSAPPESGHNVRDDTIRTLQSLFGSSSSPADYVGGVNHYGSRIFGRDSASSLSFAGLTGAVGNIAAGLISAASAHVGEGLVKHHGQASDVVRKRQLSGLQAGYHSTQAAQELAIQRGEHLDGITPNTEFTPPPVEHAPRGSDIVETRQDDSHRLHISEIPVITTFTAGDMTYTIDFESFRATVIDHPPAPSRVAPVPASVRAADAPRTPNPETETETTPGATQPPPPRDSTPSDEHRPVYPPRRITNFVRGAQWREPWWRLDPIPPFVVPPTPSLVGPEDPTTPPPTDPPTQEPPSTEQPPQDPPIQRPPAVEQPPQAPPSQPGDPAPPASQPPTNPSECVPPTSPPGSDPPPDHPGDGHHPPPLCGGEHHEECGLVWRPADEKALQSALDAAQEAARLMGMRLVQLPNGQVVLELPDGSRIRIALECFSGGDGEALEVERDGDELTVRVNSDASILDIALDVVSGLTAVGRFETGAPMEPNLFGDEPRPPGTPYSIPDFQQMARLELVLGYLGESRCTTDTETLRLLLARQLDDMGIADGDPYADQMRALLPDELRGTLLHELGTWGQMDAEHVAVTEKRAGDETYWENVRAVEEVTEWPTSPRRG